MATDVHFELPMHAAHSAEERLQGLIQGLDAVVWEADADTFRVTFVSNRAETLLGFPVSEWLNDPDFWAHHIHPEDIEPTFRSCQQATRECRDHRLEYRMVARDGRTVWVHDIVRVVPDTQGRPAKLRGILLDITARKESEQRLAQKEEQFRTLVENVSIGVYRTTPDGRVLHANPALIRMLGYSSFEELARRDLESKEFAPSYSRNEFKERMERDGEVRGLEAAWRRRDGSVLFVRENAKATRNRQGRVLYYEGTVEDISERKKAEEQLHVSSEILERINALVLVADSEGRITFVSPSVRWLLGYEPQELIGEGWWQLSYASPEAKREKELVTRIARGELPISESPYERQVLHRDGTPRWIVWHDARGPNGSLIGVGHDVTERRLAEQKLKERTTYLHALIQNSPQGIVVVDSDLRVQMCNLSFTRLFGYRQGEIVGLSLDDFIAPPELAAEAQDLSQRALASGGVEATSRRRRKDGTLVDVEIQGVPLIVDGRFIGGIGFYQDITERKQAEQALREGEERFRRLVESVADAIFVHDLEGRIVDVNEQACRSLGYTRDELLRMHVPDVEAKPDLSPVSARWREATPVPEITLEGIHKRKDGSTFPVEIKAASLDFRGQRYVLATARDVTDRKRAEEELRRRTTYLNALIQGSPLAIVAYDTTGRVQMCNPAFERVFQYSPAETVGAMLDDLISDQRLRQDAEQSTQRVLSGQAVHTTSQRKRKDGTLLDVERHSVPLRVDGQVIGGFAFYQDISERKRAEEALRRAEEKYRTIFQNGLIGIFQTTLDGRFVTANPTEARIFGYDSPEELMASITDTSKQLYVVPGRRNEPVDMIFKEGAVNELESQVYRKDGSIIWISENVRVLRDAEGKPVGFEGTTVDVTERKQAEQALQEMNQTLQTIIQMSPLAIIAMDPAHNIRLWNRAAEQIFGWNAHEVLNRPNPTIPEGDVAEFEGRFQGTLHGETRHGLPLLRKHKDGALIDVTLWSTPLRDPQGQIIGTMGIFEDAREKKNLEGQLRQAQKMEAVGRLAGGVAHDFNNLLLVISGYGELLLDRLPPESPLRKNAEEIQKAADRASTLTRQLLAFSRKQVLQPKVLSLNTVVAEMQHMLRRLIPENIELHYATDPQLGPVRADPGQLEQVILNLAVNARDAMPNGGKLVIETSNADLDQDYAAIHPDIKPGPYVQLAVSDTGSGMDAETRARIFEPFFTTKDKFKGTGLGLATVYGVVKQSGGHVTVYSELGCGSTFRVYLPRIEDAAAVKARAKDTASLAAGSETVLLVEDENGVRELAREFLTGQGYQVLTARDGREALEIAGTHPGPIHLMMTDVVMPGMSGRELAEQMGQLRPGIKVLYASGYSDEAIVHQGLLTPGTIFLQKPFPLHTLARKVRQALEGAATPTG